MEIWKPVVWYEWLYEVSNLWNIKSLWKFRWSWIVKILKPWKTWKKWSEYLSVVLYKDFEKKQFRVHRLVAQSFIPNPENKPEINHINWIKDDNKVENLEWNTKSENMQHRSHTLNYKTIFETNNPNVWKIWKDAISSKAVNQYDKDWKFIKSWWSMADVYRELWIDSAHICKVCKWNRKTTGWFIWKYKN